MEELCCSRLAGEAPQQCYLVDASTKGNMMACKIPPGMSITDGGREAYGDRYWINAAWKHEHCTLPNVCVTQSSRSDAAGDTYGTTCEIIQQICDLSTKICN